MPRSVSDLIRIAASGGGFTIDARDYSVSDLIRIAAAAGSENTRLDFTATGGLSTDDLVKIAVAGRGSVRFA